MGRNGARRMPGGREHLDGATEAGALGYRQTTEGVSTATELPFGTTRELKFINSFYCLLLLCGAQSQISDPQGQSPLCHGTA